MATLTAEVQNFIVAEFAVSKSGSQIVKSVKTEFGLDLDRQQVWHYHPDNPQLAEKWKVLYHQLREKLVTDVHACVGAHRAFRLRELVSLYWQAKGMTNLPLCAELLKQMAQEVGDVFTNKQNITVNPRAALAGLLGVDESELPENAGK